MIFHIGIFIWLLLSVLLGLKKNKENIIYKSNYIICVLVFFFYSFLRWERGTDWIPYYQNFINNNNFYEFYNAWHFEKGFQIMNYIVKILIENYTIFLFVQAVIIHYLFSITIYKNIENPIVGLFILYCFSLGNMYFVRSTIALALIFFSIKYIKKNEKIKFMGLILLAATIHITALFFLPAIYIYRVRITKFHYLLILIVSIIFGTLFLRNLLEIVFKIISPHRLIYLSEQINKLTIIINTIIPRLIFLVYFIIFIDFREKSDNETIGYFNLYYFGVILAIILSNINPALLRLSTIFEIFNLLLFPQIFIFKKNRILFVIIFIIYFYIKFYSVFFGKYHDLYIPMKTIYNEEIIVEKF